MGCKLFPTLVLALALMESSGIHAWGMENHSGVLRNQRGTAIGGATVTVYLAGTTTLAALFSDNGITAKANPFTTDIFEGRYNFYAANGVYDIVFRSPGITFNPSHTKRISLFDVSDGGGGGGGGGTGTIDGTVGTTDEAVPVANGTGGNTLKASGCTISNGIMTCPNGFRTTGGFGGSWTVVELTAPDAPTNAGEELVYVESTTQRLTTIPVGGPPKEYLATNDTQTVTNKVINGTQNTIILFDDYWWPVAGCNNATAGPVFNLPPTNAATPGCDTGTNQFSAYMEFADAANQAFYGDFILPANYQGTGLNWNFRYWMDTGSTLAVGLCVQLVRVPLGTTRDPAFPAMSTSNCASSSISTTAGAEKFLNIPSVTCASCTAGDRVMFRISRDGNGSVVADTATGKVRMTYTGPSYVKSY